MIQRDHTHDLSANRDLPDNGEATLSDNGEANDIPRRLRLSSREIGVAVALTIAAVIQLFWSLSKPDEMLTSASPDPAAIIRNAR